MTSLFQVWDWSEIVCQASGLTNNKMHGKNSQQQNKEENVYIYCWCLYHHHIIIIIIAEVSSRFFFFFHPYLCCPSISFHSIRSLISFMSCFLAALPFTDPKLPFHYSDQPCVIFSAWCFWHPLFIFSLYQWAMKFSVFFPTGGSWVGGAVWPH